MNLHEYQACELLKRAGILVPAGTVVSDMHDVRRVIQEARLDRAVIKAQVHAGGRGKAGGVRIAKSVEDILKFSQEMLGMQLVTKQTGREGITVRQLLLSQVVNVDKEYYLAVTIDRQRGQAVVIASPDGGMDIEEVAQKNPDRVVSVPLRFDGILKPYYQMRICNLMGWTDDVARQGMAILSALAKLFISIDAALIEINPLVRTMEGQLLALDAKISIDENALFRQQKLALLFDKTQLSHHEAEAKKHDLAYVAMDGTIGCMVNGAGLAMATMDIIHHYHGKPANFLDVGGGATQEKVAEGFKLILSDRNVKAILVNIFGGIMNCVTLAGGIIVAAGHLGISVPLIVRMEGNNVDNGKRMLFDSGLNIIVADSLDEAARKAVAAAKG